MPMTFLALPGIQELWPIALIIILLFGARKLPELARAAGSSISMFKRGLKEADDGEGAETPAPAAAGERPKVGAAAEAKDSR